MPYKIVGFLNTLSISTTMTAVLNHMPVDNAGYCRPLNHNTSLVKFPPALNHPLEATQI